MRARSTYFLSFLLLLSLVVPPLFADRAAFVASPSVDGAIAAGEYRYFQTIKSMDYGVALSPDGSLLTLAIRASTPGWVAIGLGSTVMDGSWMVMGYDTGTSAMVGEMLGKGHFYQKASSSRVAKSAVDSTGGATILEFQVKTSDFLKEGKLALILAYGKKADFVSIHAGYAVVTLDLGK